MVEFGRSFYDAALKTIAALGAGGYEVNIHFLMAWSHAEKWKRFSGRIRK